MFKGLQLSFHDKTVVVVDGQAQDYVTGDTIRVTESLNQRSSTVPANTYKDTVLVPRTDGFCIDLRGDYAKSMTGIVFFDEVGVEKKATFSRTFEDKLIGPNLALSMLKAQKYYSGERPASCTCMGPSRREIFGKEETERRRRQEILEKQQRAIQAGASLKLITHPKQIRSTFAF
ncbi:MAG: hypothetical protein GY822_26680 [Deltaproteobacteria bacterium]|nr:hypothetical protein [Deltaproteobacteria bacterium]